MVTYLDKHVGLCAVLNYSCIFLGADCIECHVCCTALIVKIVYKILFSQFYPLINSCRLMWNVGRMLHCGLNS
jgi:hypothetical protein